jgi:hypothetical protein
MAKPTIKPPRAKHHGAGKSLPGKHGNPACRRARRRGRNPEADDEAAVIELTEQFHGRPVERVTEIEETVKSRATLADLGKLLQLVVWLDEDTPVDLDFSGNVRVGCTGDGRQIYFVGGDQRLNLAALGFETRDHVRIGEVGWITYHTSKDFHAFEPTDYVHEFGEEGGEMPTLNYDALNDRLYLTGGSYEVRREGIVN